MGSVWLLLGSGEAKGKISCQAQAPVAKTQGVALKEAKALGLQDLQLTSSWYKLKQLMRFQEEKFI